MANNLLFDAVDVESNSSIQETTTTTKIPTKKLVQPEVKYGTLVVNNTVFYALHVKATVATGGGLFGGFGTGLLSTADSATTEPETINTIFLAGVKPKSDEVRLLEVTETSELFNWLAGDKSAKYEIPTYLNEQLRTMVGSSMATFKGILSNYKPLSDEHVSLLYRDTVIVSSIQDFKEAALQLRDVIEEAKKSGGNLGLDAFIDRYAFTNHVLLAGPRGVKSFHDTIAA